MATWIFKKKIIFRKYAAKFLEISKKHVFVASNRNIIKNSMEKMIELKTNFVRKY